MGRANPGLINVEATLNLNLVFTPAASPLSCSLRGQILRKAAKQAEEQASLKRSVPSSSAAAGGAAGVYGPGAGAAAAAAAAASASTPRVGGGAGSVRKKRRWDDGGDGDETPAVASGKAVSDWDADVATPVRRGGFGGGETPGRTPGGGGETPGRSRWDQTPSRDAQETPVARRTSRWDQSGGATPVAGGVTPGGGGVTPGGIGDTPKAGSKWDDETPRAGGLGAGETPSGRKKSRWDQVRVRAVSLLLAVVFFFFFSRFSFFFPAGFAWFSAPVAVSPPPDAGWWPCVFSLLAALLP